MLVHYSTSASDTRALARETIIECKFAYFVVKNVTLDDVICIPRGLAEVGSFTRPGPLSIFLRRGGWPARLTWDSLVGQPFTRKEESGVMPIHDMFCCSKECNSNRI